MFGLINLFHVGSFVKQLTKANLNGRFSLLDEAITEEAFRTHFDGEISRYKQQVSLKHIYWNISKSISLFATCLSSMLGVALFDNIKTITNSIIEIILFLCQGVVGYSVVTSIINTHFRLDGGLSNFLPRSVILRIPIPKCLFSVYLFLCNCF